MAQIKRVTNQQKKIINRILELGLNHFYYSGDAIDDLMYEFSAEYWVIKSCIEYVENKFQF